MTPRARLDRWFSTDARWILFLLFAAVAVLFGPLALGSSVSYNRWDNYEYYTPIINQVHSCLLGGQMPRINLHQHLGEPIQSNVQAGLFYIPYTLAVAIQKALGLPLDALQTVIVAIHLPLCMTGIYLVLRNIGVRPWLAATGALSTSSAGFVITHTSVWAVTLPNFTWLAWIILGSILVMEERRTLLGGTLIAFGIPLIAAIGHGQLMCYALLYLGLIIGLGGVVRFAYILQLARLIPFLFTGLLLSAPAVLPVLLFIPQTNRSSSFTREQFYEASAQPAVFAGLLSPLFEVGNGFMSEFKTSLFFYQGAQVVPLITAFVVFGIAACRRTRFDGRALFAGSSRLLRFGGAVLVVSLLFSVFALGSGGIIYGWTYGIPTWSSFRWPYKFLLFTAWGFGIVAAIGGELLIRHPAESRRVRIILPLSCLAFMLGGLLWRRTGQTTSIPGITALGTGMTTLLLLPFVHTRWVAKALVPVLLLSAVATVSLVHHLGPRTYDEPYGRFTASTYGIDPAYRAFSFGYDTQIQQCALFHMATANGYYALSGCTHPFVPSIFTNMIPCTIDGKPNAPLWVFSALRSHFLRSINVRYVIVANAGLNEVIAYVDNRQVGVQEYLKTTGYSPIKKLASVTVYASEHALPRAYFASQLFRWTADGMRKGLVDNESAIDSAYITDLPRDYPSFPHGQVVNEDWEHNGTVKLDVNSPEHGFLVLSLAYLPDWRAWVDEKPTPIHTVNGLVMGIEIPPGATRVRFDYFPRGQTLGLVLAGGGFIGLAIWVAGVRVMRQRHAVA